MTTIHEDDLKLVRLASKHGDHRRDLAKRLYPRVYQVVRMLVGGRQDAEDLAQSCLVEILECLPRYQGRGKLESWAGRIAYRRIKKTLFAIKTKEGAELLCGDEQGETAAASEKEMVKRRTREWLSGHLKTLPPERRSTVVLHFAYGHTLAEIADITGVPLNTAKSRMLKGLRELRASVEKDHAMGEEMLEGADVWG